MENQQTKLQQWILKQPYFFLNVKYDGMTAWELAGKILEAIKTTEEEKKEVLSYFLNHANGDTLSTGL